MKWNLPTPKPGFQDGQVLIVIDYSAGATGVKTTLAFST